MLIRLQVLINFPNYSPLQKGAIVNHVNGKFLKDYAVVTYQGQTWYIQPQYMQHTNVA